MVVYYYHIGTKYICLNFSERNVYKMKQYPYTNSTDMILYEPKVKKKRKPKLWLACLSSALSASIITAGVVGTGFYFYSQNDTKVEQKGSDQLVIGQQNSTLVDDVSYISTNTGEALINGKTVLTTEQIAAGVGPSVVGVINKAKMQAQRYYDPFSGRWYYSQGNVSEETVEQGSGSGIIITTSGYIVTNEHVINGAEEIVVILNTGDEYPATLIGKDTKTDLAVLKIEPGGSELKAAVLGDSTKTVVGERAVAIGNPLGQEFSGTTTQGIISAVNRTMSIDNRTYNLLQTDAAINSGNSGGPLINQYGEVIGINSIKLSDSGVEGLGFAIAISEAKPIIEDLMENGYVSGRPLVGIEVSETRYGLFISGVNEGSGAYDAGLKEGDMISKVDGVVVKTSAEINEIRDKKKPGESLKFTIMRDGEILEIDVVLTEDSSNKPQ